MSERPPGYPPPDPTPLPPGPAPDPGVPPGTRAPAVGRRPRHAARDSREAHR